jgi:hypothetical protein
MARPGAGREAQLLTQIQRASRQVQPVYEHRVGAEVDGDHPPSTWVSNDLVCVRLAVGSLVLHQIR